MVSFPQVFPTNYLPTILVYRIPLCFGFCIVKICESPARL